MTIYITREYDENEIYARLQEVRPDLNLSSTGRLKDIDAEGPVGNIDGRDVEVTFTLRLTDNEFQQVFDNPRA